MASVTISTKTLQNIIKIILVPQNVSKFVQKSQVVQLTADAQRDALRINVETAHVVSEATIKGQFDGETASLFVDTLMLRNLVATLVENEITVTMTNDSISITDGKSQYALEKIADISDGEFKSPRFGDRSIESIKSDDWQFVKDHMLFTLAESANSGSMAQQYVYLSNNGTAVTGDFFRTMFSKYSCADFGNTYLIAPEVINALCLVPDTNSAYAGDRYITVVVDSQDANYASEFQFQSEDTIGSFNAPLIMDLFDDSSDSGLSAASADIVRVLNQSDIVSGKAEEFIRMTMSGSEISFKDRRIESSIRCEGNLSETYSALVSKSRLRSMVGSCPSKTVQINAILRDGIVQGLSISGGNAAYVIGTSAAM